MLVRPGPVSAGAGQDDQTSTGDWHLDALLGMACSARVKVWLYAPALLKL